MLTECGVVDPAGLFIGPENAFSGDNPIDLSGHYLINYPTRPEEVGKVIAMLGSHPMFSGIKMGINTIGGKAPEGQAYMSLIIPHEIYMPEFFKALAKVFGSETV